jgi:TonB-dependent receptor
VKSWGQVTDTAGDKVWSPTEFSEIPGTIMRRNIGADAAVGAAFDHVTFELRGFYSQFDSPSTVNSTIVDPTPAAAGGKVTDFAADGGLVNATVNRELQGQNWVVSLAGVMFKGNVELSDTLDVDFGYAHQNAAERYPLKIQGESNGVKTTTPLPLMLAPNVVALGPFSGALPSILSASAVPLAYIQNAPRDDEEASDTPYVNVTKKFSFDDGSGIALKAGTYLNFLNKSADLIQTKQNVLPGNNLTFANLQDPNAQALTRGGVYFGTLGDVDAARGLIPGMPSAFGPVIVNNPRGLDPKDYQAKIDMQAYYGMVTYTNGPLTLIGGGRYEEDHTTFLRTSTTTSNGLQYFDATTSEFLPSVHARYAIDSDLIARASWSNTTARPDPQQVYANQSIDLQAKTITQANPGLKPLKSENVDASLDWYFGPLNYITVGVFTKDITDYPLTTQQTVNYMGQVFSETSIQSNARGSIRGFEIGYRQQFDELPGLLSGFGIEANYANIHSKLIYAARPDMPPLEQQPSDVINASLVYAYGPAFIRLAMAHVGKEIDDEGTATNGPAYDIEVAPRTTLDLSMSYDITDHLQTFAEWRNITNAAAVSFQGDRSRLSSWESFGTAGGVGVRVKF